MDGHTDSMKARTHSKHLTCFLKRTSRFIWLNTHQKALRSASAPPRLHYSDPATKPLCSRSAWLDWAKRNKKLRDWADTRSVLQVLWNLLLQIKSSATLNTLNWGQYHDVCRSCKETSAEQEWQGGCMWWWFKSDTCSAAVGPSNEWGIDNYHCQCVRVWRAVAASPWSVQKLNDSPFKRREDEQTCVFVFIMFWLHCWSVSVCVTKTLWTRVDESTSPFLRCWVLFSGCQILTLWIGRSPCWSRRCHLVTQGTDAKLTSLYWWNVWLYGDLRTMVLDVEEHERWAINIQTLTLLRCYS